MNIIEGDVVARIGSCYEIKTKRLLQRRIVKKGDWVPQDVVKAAVQNVPDGARWWTFKDEDGDGHLLIVWKENK